ncbi:MAG: helix-turn-helix domain-containing protein, partial [Candidatus Limivicinus sp.]
YGDTVKSQSPRIPLKPDNVLFPALMYIEENPEKVVGMHEMAELCHLSHSYFSKIFQREMGENFTDYVGKRKVELAKKMLRESSDSVTSIASKLGFMDTSYFIKVFKKYEGTTPLVYRRQKYR